jgi:heat shock protein HslJ
MLYRFAALLLALCMASTPSLAQTQRHRGRQPEHQQPKPLPAPEKRFPYNARWTLRELNGKPLPSGVEATLRIDQNNHGAGVAGCNNWSSPMLPIPGQRLAMGAIALTRRSCPASVMAFERTYLLTLHAGPKWDLVGSDLVVQTPQTTLRFSRGL